MRRKFSLILTLTAWLLATGSHWDLVQTFAWGRMIAIYAQSMPLREAVRLTFTPDNLCSVCKVVSEAKQQDGPGSLPAGKWDVKILLAFAPNAETAFTAPASGGWLESGPLYGSAFRTPPPLPPPRGFLI